MRRRSQVIFGCATVKYIARWAECEPQDVYYVIAKFGIIPDLRIKGLSYYSGAKAVQIRGERRGMALAACLRSLGYRVSREGVVQ